MKTPRQILLEAADHIERYGKAEEAFVVTPGVALAHYGLPLWMEAVATAPMCAMGAIAYAASGDPTRSLLYANGGGAKAAAALLAYVTQGGRGWNVYTWSDAHSAREVVDALRGAAAEI